MTKFRRKKADDLFRIRRGDGMIVEIYRGDWEGDDARAGMQVRRRKVVLIEEAERRLAAGWTFVKGTWYQPK